MLEKRVIFINGRTHEHGGKIALQQPSGRNPKEHCDTNSNKMLWDQWRTQEKMEGVHNSKLLGLVG